MTKAEFTKIFDTINNSANYTIDFNVNGNVYKVDEIQVIDFKHFALLQNEHAIVNKQSIENTSIDQFDFYTTVITPVKFEEL